MELQNFVDMRGPAVSAAFLNQLDVLRKTVFNEAQTLAAARSVLFNDFSAVEGGLVDASAVFQSKVNAGGLIKVFKGRYLVANVLVPDNTVFDCEPGTVFVAKMTVTETSAYPTPCFVNANQVGGNVNILFRNCKFDFNRGVYPYLSSATCLTGHGLYFKNVEGLIFDRVWFHDFMTPLNTTNHVVGTLGLTDITMMQLDSCTNVLFKNIKTTRISVEGIGTYNCVNVCIDGWNANGLNDDSTNRTSSHLDWWNVQGAVVRNANITHTGGSVFNVYGRGILYENVRVNDGQSQLGEGFDFGDEAGLGAAFPSRDIEVRNCYLNVIRNGMLWSGDNYGTLPENISFHHNTILVNGLVVGDFATGITLREGRNIFVTKNIIRVTGSAEAQTSGFAGACVQIRPGTTLPNLEQVFIDDNEMEGYAGVVLNTLGINTTDVRKVRGLYITRNRFTAVAMVAGNEAFLNNGASSFLAVTLRTGTDVGLELYNCYVEENTALNLGGHFASFKNLTLTSNVNVCKNKGVFVSPQATSGVNMASTTVDTAAVINVNENQFYELGLISLPRAEVLKVRGNFFKWATAHNAAYVSLATGAYGTFEYWNNQARGVDDALAAELTHSSTLPTFDLFTLGNNRTLNDAGNIQFKHDLGNSYEEGDITVTMECGTSGTITLKTTHNKLHYHRSGNLVSLTGHLEVLSVSSPVGAVNVVGLNYPLNSVSAVSQQAAVAVRADGLAAGATTALQGYVEVGVNRIRLEKFSAGAAAALAGNVQADAAFYLSVGYMAP